MGKLDSLKIDDCPYAFASFAAKHNALVDMLAAMEGQGGISVVIAEKNAIIRSSSTTGPAPSGSTANVVGSTGLLQNVYVGNTIANAYPTTLRSVDGSITCKLGVDGFQVLSGSNIVIEFNPAGGWYLKNFTTGKRIFADVSLVTKDMDLREIDVCDSGVAKKMLIIGSAPYV